MSQGNGVMDSGGADNSLTLEKAGERSGLSPATIRSQNCHGRIPADTRGRDLFVRWAAVEHYPAIRSPRGRYRKDMQAEGYMPPEESGV